MKNIITKLILIGAITLSVSCSGTLNKLNKIGDGLTSGDYNVKVYSGGEIVEQYEIRNSFVNSESQSDGWFFYVDGKLRRVTGTIVIEEL
jgi:hypothetical protein